MKKLFSALSKNKYLPVAIAVSAVLPLTAQAGEVDQKAMQAECLKDLQAIPGYLARNDPGALAVLKQKGEAYFAEHLAAATKRIGEAKDRVECNLAITEYLSRYRSGHLHIKDLSGAATRNPDNVKSGKLAFKSISPKTAWVSVPSFSPLMGDRIDKLLMENQKAIDAAKNLVIDLRRNGGGSDALWRELAVRVKTNAYRSFNMEYLATKDNAAAARSLTDHLTLDKATAQMLEQEVRTLEKVDGEFISMDGRKDAARFGDVFDVKAPAGPARVAVIFDKHCASSCEEFVLLARQSWKTKTFGEPSAGMLDISNLRPFKLPSGSRVLFYGISRSARLPEMPIDGAGIQPDFLIPGMNEAVAPSHDDEVAKQVLKLMQG